MTETTKSITIEYYALLKEQSGVPDERIETSAPTVKDLYMDRKGQYDFTLSPEALKVAVNDEFVPWETSLSSGDTVVFIPPVAGG